MTKIKLNNLTIIECTIVQDFLHEYFGNTKDYTYCWYFSTVDLYKYRFSIDTFYGNYDNQNFSIVIYLNEINEPLKSLIMVKFSK